MADIPLGATEDMRCGTIVIEKALAQSKNAFEPDLLANANRGSIGGRDFPEHPLVVQQRPQPGWFNKSEGRQQDTALSL